MAKGDTVLQAIETRYYGPGNVRGARVIASAAAGRVTVEWDDALNAEENHRAAADVLIAKLDWLPKGGRYVHGVLKDGRNVFVFAAGE